MSVLVPVRWLKGKTKPFDNRIVSYLKILGASIDSNWSYDLEEKES